MLYNNNKSRAITMRYLNLFIPFLIAGCVMSATDTNIQATKDTVVALEKSLPESCKTDAIKAQIDAIKQQIESVKATCKAEISEVTAQKHTWQIATGALVMLILVVLWFKLKK